jgi:hypothetical protein
MQLPDGTYIFGDSEQWVQFTQTHPAFFKVFGPLNQTMRRVLIRTFEVDSVAKEIIHFLGRLFSDN